MASFLERDQLIPVQPQLQAAEPILQNLQQDQQLYALDASRLNSQYGNLLGLNLTREDNRNDLNGLLDTAHTQLKGYAQTDLGIGENASQAQTVFNPITSNDNIMGDHAYTQHISNELEKANKSRTTDSGKGYNQASADAINYQRQLFATNSDKANWRMFYNNKEQYTPYRDINEWLTPAAAAFKTDVAKTDLTTPGYIMTHKDASWYKEKWQQYVEANAPAWVKQQLGTEGRADYYRSLLLYKNDPQGLYGQYSNQLEGIKNDRRNSMTEILNEEKS